MEKKENTEQKSGQALEMAVAHHQAGRLPQAESLYRQILENEPDHAIALHLLGVIAHQFGKSDRAVGLIQKALSIQPQYADAHNNLGTALQELGKLEDAAASYERALAIKPDYTQAHNNLGNALQNMGRPKEAVASYGRALKLAPDYAEAHNNLGNALQDLGRLEDAVTSHNRALALNPDYAKAHNNLGNALRGLGRAEEAFACQRRAVALDPQDGVFWTGLEQCLESQIFTRVDDGLLHDLMSLLEQPTVNSQRLITAILSALCLDPEFGRILEDEAEEIAYGEVARQLSAKPLFLKIMALSPIDDLRVERMLTRLRRAMSEDEVVGEGLEFLVALALQCFANEYVFQETDGEKEWVEELSRLAEKGKDIPPHLLAVLGAYRPLSSFPWAKKLDHADHPAPIKEVIRRQITEPRMEQSLRAQIPQLTLIENTVSQSVRDQYEENPYPRWIRSGILENANAIGTVLGGAPLHLDLGGYVSPDNPEILVAGCGTGRHALIAATRFAGAKVLAVDLSLSSLSYAQRKTEEIKIPNLEYAQADIMELGSLERRFDLIESLGVLHHLGEPLEGWRILVDLLHPGGLIKIGLYSETARREIVEARAMIADEGYKATADDMRRCRQEIIAKAESGDQAMGKICNISAFFSLSECRDLLFHVQEHRFTLPQIETALGELGLKFLGFEIGDQQAIHRFRKTHSQARALTSLSLWHKFELENPRIFMGMYQFWCRKL